MRQHIADAYVQRAVAGGYRSRAAFKLIEIDQQDRLLRRGQKVVDLGAAPGSWSQVIAQRVRPEGRVIALDVLPMEAIPGVVFVQGDFREQTVVLGVLKALAGDRVDLVVSDMAPNLSGVAPADAARMSDLVELAVDFAVHHLKPEGSLLVKCFHGTGYSQLVELFKRSFVKVAPRKPRASRDKSAETYLLGTGLKAR